MNSGRPRDELESDLARSLSRYIGYTTGAYSLQRIVSTLKPFAEMPSAYSAEVIEFLLSDEDDEELDTKHTKRPSSEYLEEVLNFATSMGILESVSDRQVRLRRLAPTQLGRSLMGVAALQEAEFYQYYLSKVVLMSDADALMPVLLAAGSGLTGDQLRLFYVDFQMRLREQRREWLTSAFPERILLSRVADQISWLKPDKTAQDGYKIAPLTANSARHHVTPRQGWLRQLGMVDDKDSQLTQFGHDVINSLTEGGEYFWLGPPEGTEEGLHIARGIQKGGPFEDSLNFRHNARAPTRDELDQIVDDTAATMMSAYARAKLVFAPQASLQIPIQYIYFRSYREGIELRWLEVIEEVFKKYRTNLKRLSAVKGQIGFYKYDQ